MTCAAEDCHEPDVTTLTFEITQKRKSYCKECADHVKSLLSDDLYSEEA